MAKTITTADGLKIRILRPAPRGPRLRPGDTVGVFYDGKLIDGTPFDANFDFVGFRPLNQLFVFTLGKNQVIQGWEKGLLNRRVGEVLELTIPPDQGYGSSGQGTIPPNARLVFRLVLLGVIPAEQAALPEAQRAPRFYNLKDLGLKPSSLGLSEKLLSAELSTVQAGRLLVGTNLPDTITGLGSGELSGELLLGLRGNDRLSGGQGRDIQVGGNGGDTFVYTTLGDSPAGQDQRDVIADFQGRQRDRIDLSAIDADPGLEGNQGFIFIGSAAFSGQPGELRYRSGLLQGNAKGDLQADLEIELLGDPNLLAGHLLL